MAFEQDLRTYLEGLEHEAAEGSDSSSRYVDEHTLHRHFTDRLRELEHAGGPALAVVERLFSEWPPKLARFARFLEALPWQLVPVDAEGALAFARRALDQAIGCLDRKVSLVDRLELKRVVDMFAEGIEVYALENQLVHAGGTGPTTLTEPGRVFLRLRGRDAIRWLLTVEVVQSLGPSDRWHTSHELLSEAVGTYGIPVNPFGGGFEYAGQTLDRLTSIGVLQARKEPPDFEIVEYRTPTKMRDVVQAVLEQGPWHTAIRALLDDERALVLPGTASSATEATVEQAKLITHEVRNALIPVRHDIDALRLVATEPAQKQRIDAAKQGVVRVLEFVDAMVQTSELITEPPTRCEIRAVVDEALGWIDTGRRVKRLPFLSAVYLIAPRARLARAISNILGNALQATTVDQPVRVSIARATGVVRVVVDDGGPGVPIEHRARVFLEGVTMRQDGAGSGFGLASARRVVEGALHGKVWCEDSDLGGARFVIELPEASE